MLVETENLVGAGDIARHFNVTDSAVAHWKSRKDFPKPVASPSNGLVWDIVPVSEWVRQREERPKPPKRRYVPRWSTKYGHVVFDNERKVYLPGSYTSYSVAKRIAKELSEDALTQE